MMQCARRLLDEPSAGQSASDTTVPKHVDKLDLLATEELASAYGSRGGKTGGGRVAGGTEVSRWLSGK